MSTISLRNAQVADLLRRYAAALSLEGANRFKLKAYRRAAETIEGLDESVADYVRQGKALTDLSGIGAAISEIITEILATGKLVRLERTMSHLNPELVELASRPALDPKIVRRVYKKLDINSLAELENRLESGVIGTSLGSRVEYHIRQALDERPRHLLWSVEDTADRILEFLRSVPGVTHVSLTGSARRKRDTVADLNYLVAGRSAPALFKAFDAFSGILSFEKHDGTERAYKLSSGLNVTIRVVDGKKWGIALILATGSLPHIQDLQEHARKRRQSFPIKGRKKATDELNVYASLGLDYIEPELREGRGEVHAASCGELPKLVQLSDLRGDLHMHTTESDGANTLAEMAKAAEAHGYEYIAITDHSQSLKITNGLSEERLLRHIRAIDKLNGKLSGLRILKSAEVDILEDGKLDYSNAVLKELDFTICSIHSRFGLDKEQQTTRILRAMDNRYFTILGHATGRLLLKRPGYEVDMKRVFAHARKNGRFFEINSSPDRLDLSDEHAKAAKELGIRVAINTDAHSIRELKFISAGINQARRAWLTAPEVLNALSLEPLLRVLRL
jgi:DNA polymerase (family 10)